jgi:hypothetical protein
VPSTAVIIPQSLISSLVNPLCLRVSLCDVVALPGVQLDLSWVLPQSSVTPAPAPLVPCGSKNCPNAGSLYSQILIWPSGDPAGEVVNIQSVSGCAANIRLTVSADYDCNLATFI